MDIVDRAGPVRNGEALDIQRLEPFLRDSIAGLQGEIKIRQFPSGHSNLTYLITVGDREMVLRRPPFGYKAKSAHDMGREYKVLKALQGNFPYAPKPLAYSDDPAIIGDQFYVMDRLSGIILRKDPPAGLNYTPGQATQLCENFLQVLLEFQALDYDALGLGDLGRPAGYVARQVNGTCKRYLAAQTPDAPTCEEYMQWLQDKQPPDTDQPALIHNDLKFDNMVLALDDPTQFIGILDWELTTVGDPLMDVGISLSYWVEPDDPAEMELIRTIPTNLEGMLTRQQILQRYEKMSGRQVEYYDFYYLFGLFRMLVVVQQMYFRYYHGQTRDRRFKHIVQMVFVLDKIARQIIAKSKL
jgi:aminoglycoside phosphotransferase (APT) family kinase protein